MTDANSEQKQTKKGQKEKPPAILVLGDWIIDENWVVAKHNTFNSSHTGDTHYISQYNNTKTNITSLCGVPKIMEVLRTDQSIKCKIIGIGIWNKDDDETMKCMICPQYTNFNHYRLNGVKHPTREDICPYSEDENSKCEGKPEIYNLSSDDGVSSNRIIRIYEDSGGKLRQLSRYDWELPTNDIKVNDELIKTIIKNNDIKAIIIQDHNKGVITNSTIKTIIEALGSRKPKWYIRTKADEPEWLERLIAYMKKRHDKIRLRTIDYKIAQKKGQRLFNYEKELGRVSLELLGKYTGDDQYRDGKKYNDAQIHTERVAILLNDNTVIAKENDKCYFFSSPGPEQNINVGRTTIFFAALILQDLLSNKLQFNDQCYRALWRSYYWSERTSKNGGNVNNSCKPQLYASISDVFKKRIIKGKNNYGEIYNGSWEKWNQSSNSLGIITTDDKNLFQLWRGEGSIKGYLCSGGQKRDGINRTLFSLHEYNQKKDPDYPLNCLLVASPGWGKSFLAKSIAKMFNFYFMEFSMSQMASTTDLVECFDTICSYQSMHNDKLLIFMDEVNCEIQGSPAMGLLLSPIWDGSYTRNGRSFRLKPAVWMFASTESINELIKHNKGLDYTSRLNGPVVNLDLYDDGKKFMLNKFKFIQESSKEQPEVSLAELLGKFKKTVLQNPNDPKNDGYYNELIDVLEDNIFFSQMRTDQVYIGVSLLNQMWGPITLIEKEVLQIFYNLIPINGYRSLQFFVQKFKNIQRRKVVVENIPELDEFEELKRHIYLRRTTGDIDRSPITIETSIKK